jgi:tetratricopeptide (TPR) repeat protein
MNDVGNGKQGPAKKKPKPGAPAKRGPGMFADPAVMRMAYIAAGLVILFLAMVVGALATGVTAPSGPRTAAERDLLLASEGISRGGKGEAYAPYISALVATGDISQARLSLVQARASITGTMPVMALDLAEARILTAEKRYSEAATMADKAMKGYQTKYDQGIAKGGAEAQKAAAAGLGNNYYDSLLVKAYALVDLRRYKEAVAAFDIYITKVPTASDILIDRGNAKADMNDKAGAEKDFREALKYVPYDTEAKAGLKRIGAAQ